MLTAAQRADALSLVDAWKDAMLRRDSTRLADLFIRDPAPLVAWASGELSHSWKDVFAHTARDFQRSDSVPSAVDVFDLEVEALSDETLELAFHYEVETQDMWGAKKRATRVATMTLRATKDGLRIASAHFAPAAGLNR